MLSLRGRVPGPLQQNFSLPKKNQLMPVRPMAASRDPGRAGSCFLSLNACVFSKSVKVTF